MFLVSVAFAVNAIVRSRLEGHERRNHFAAADYRREVMGEIIEPGPFISVSQVPFAATELTPLQPNNNTPAPVPSAPPFAQVVDFEEEPSAFPKKQDSFHSV